MQELSLNILDVAQNSITAKASLIQLTIEGQGDSLYITLQDNGSGMGSDTLNKVTDPFFTSRTTRKVGLGIPFFKQAALMTGGSFDIESKEGIGTTVKAIFNINHIDYTPLGSIADTMAVLIQANPELNFTYTAINNEKTFIFDTREIKKIMEDVPLSDLAVAQWIKDFIKENHNEIFTRRY